MTRIILIHVYSQSIEPIMAEFRTQWPEAQVLNLLDESLYADVSADSASQKPMDARITTLIHHAEASGADAVVFTGATFGPEVDQARRSCRIPILKADEALCAQAATRKGRMLVVGTNRRALPIILDHIAAEVGADSPPQCDALCVDEARIALERGDMESHDRAIAHAVEAASGAYSTIILSQISMAPARRLLTQDIAARTLTSPQAAVSYLRRLFDDRR